MGDTFQHVVVPSARLEDAPRLADAVVKELIQCAILSDEHTDCTLDDDGGYPPGRRFEEAIAGEAMQIRELRTNGMGVSIGREVFHTGSFGVDAVRCPACGFNQVDGTWSEAIEAWWEGDDHAPLKCDACGAARPIITWNFKLPWAFGCLGFTFWNWPPLNPEFVRQISQIVQRETVVVFGKL